ncbi:hypothetical protein STEG23_017570 [Scotinomys teguina]
MEDEEELDGEALDGCPSTEEWIKKMCYTYTMEYYSAEKNSDIMRFAGKWMELENIILSEMMGNHFWSKKIEISVSKEEKRTGRNAVNMQETHTAYLIETRSVEHADGQSVLTDSLWRWYSEFELLRNYLLVYYPHVVPPLPEKRAEFVWDKLSADNIDPDFVER